MLESTSCNGSVAGGVASAAEGTVAEPAAGIAAVVAAGAAAVTVECGGGGQPSAAATGVGEGAVLDRGSTIAPVAGFAGRKGGGYNVVCINM